MCLKTWHRSITPILYVLIAAYTRIYLLISLCILNLWMAILKITCQPLNVKNVVMICTLLILKAILAKYINTNLKDNYIFYYVYHIFMYKYGTVFMLFFLSNCVILHNLIFFLLEIIPIIQKGLSFLYLNLFVTK